MARPGRPGDKADLAQAGRHRGHGRPGRPGEKVDLADLAGCHLGSCPPGSPGASSRPGAHINCRSGTPTLHTSCMALHTPSMSILSTHPRRHSIHSQTDFYDTAPSYPTDVQAKHYRNGPTASGPSPPRRQDGSQTGHERYHRRQLGYIVCFRFRPQK